ncbi:hypothetical protein DNTS_009452 [Danionella cerebrum]|uniref:Uncharacterized protein n=1 Tax=Danionella cerebrum TaxID=2873325 RepID=A0A553PWS3_9TELE|nr:hypothetical protein DNTS_009452 [Danionella translucida]
MLKASDEGSWHRKEEERQFFWRHIADGGNPLISQEWDASKVPFNERDTMQGPPSSRRGEEQYEEEEDITFFMMLSRPALSPARPPLFTSQQSSNRWCSAWETSDGQKPGTNRLLGNQLTRQHSARLQGLLSSADRGQSVSGFRALGSTQAIWTMRSAKASPEHSESVDVTNMPLQIRKAIHSMPLLWPGNTLVQEHLTTLLQKSWRRQTLRFKVYAVRKPSNLKEQAHKNYTLQNHLEIF